MSYDIRRILDVLPHRQPLLLVDSVVELEAGKRIVALKNVTYNEDYFRGHFPGNPVMPGVLIIEALAQAGGVLLVETLTDAQGKKPYLVGVDRVRFRRPVVPGDQLTLEVELGPSKGAFHRFRAAARVGSEKAAEASFMLAIMEST